MMNDKKIINSFYLQDELNPDIWDELSEGDYKLKPEIRKRLLKVAELFIDYLDVDFFIHDVLFVGSLVGYNWSAVQAEKEIFGLIKQNKVVKLNKF